MTPLFHSQELGSSKLLTLANWMWVVSELCTGNLGWPGVDMDSGATACMFLSMLRPLNAGSGILVLQPC